MFFFVLSILVFEEHPINDIQEILEIKEDEPKKGKKPRKVKNDKKPKGKKKTKKNKEPEPEHEHEHELAELTGYEGLGTPELIKLTIQLDENPDMAIPKRGRSSIRHFDIEEEPQSQPEKMESEFKESQIEIEEVKKDEIGDEEAPIPVAKRTRRKRNKN